MSTPSVTPPSSATVTLTQEQLTAMIEKEVSKALAAQPGRITWQSIRSNKYFVAATSAFAGAIGSEIYEAVQNHAFVWNRHTVEPMIVSAVSATAIALYHLYTAPPTKSQENAS